MLAVILTVVGIILLLKCTSSHNKHPHNAAVAAAAGRVVSVRTAARHCTPLVLCTSVSVHQLNHCLADWCSAWCGAQAISRCWRPCYRCRLLCRACTLIVSCIAKHTNFQNFVTTLNPHSHRLYGPLTFVVGPLTHYLPPTAHLFCTSPSTKASCCLQPNPKLHHLPNPSTSITTTPTTTRLLQP